MAFELLFRAEYMFDDDQDDPPTAGAAGAAAGLLPSSLKMSCAALMA